MKPFFCETCQQPFEALTDNWDEPQALEELGHEGHDISLPHVGFPTLEELGIDQWKDWEEQ